LKVLEFLLEQGADPNETFMGHTMWQYFIHYVHTASDNQLHIGKGFIAWHRATIKKIVEYFLKKGADLDICCIEDCELWDQVYDYETSASLLHWLSSPFASLKAHVGHYKNLKIKEFKQIGSTTDLNAAVSTSFASSLGPAIEEKVSALEEIPIKGNERIVFEKCHSLTTIFREWFETKDDPHGADELLELMATLKAAKKGPEGFNHTKEN
jgi:hypothetical protein